MSKVNVPKQFVEDFFLCMEEYECSQEEIDFEKERARRDLEAAKSLFGSVASEIRLSRQIGAISSTETIEPKGTLSACGNFYFLKEK